MAVLPVSSKRDGVIHGYKQTRAQDQKVGREYLERLIESPRYKEFVTVNTG